MKVCRQCRKELPKSWSTDICLDCSGANMRKIFKENSDVKKHLWKVLRKLENQKI